MALSDKPFATWFKLFGIAFDIVIFTFLGYYVGRNFGHEVLGALLGALFGTAVTWYYIFRVAKKLEFEK
ncbi:MAG: hypothetical protein NDF55_05455 [archaeon GB-1867-005]|nr:hypothetical protein [Candidatus Culexmicrobium cathedralense]